MVTINLQTFRNANGWTDRKALEEAMKNTSPGLEIYLPAGGGTLGGGAYDIWTDIYSAPNVVSGGNLTRGDVTLYGDGYGSVIRQPDAGQPVFMAHPPGNNTGPIKSSITIRDLLLDGCLGRNPSYDEHVHLVRIAGVNGFTVQRVLFRNFMGDGLFMGSPIAALVPKNSNLLVERSRFEATSTTDRGRNGISISDCDGYTITGCSFENIGSNRPGFGPGPGAIDIEPTSTSAVVRKGKIDQCSFKTVNRSAVALLNGVGATADDVEVTYCNLLDAGFGLFDVQHHSNVRIHHNYSENLSLQGGYIGWIRNSTSVDVTSNTFINGRYIRISDISYWNINYNGFRDCAKADGVLIIQSGNATWGSVLYNELYSCGQPGSALNCIYYLQNNGTQLQFLNVKWNTVHSPTNIVQVGAVVGNYSPPPGVNPAYDYVDPSGNYPSSLPFGSLEKKP